MTVYGTQSGEAQYRPNSATAVVRTFNEKFAELPTAGDWGTSATDVAAGLTLAFAATATVALPPGAYALDTNYTIASGKTLILLPGAVLTVNSGKTLTVTGTLVYFTAAQVVATGTVTGAGKRFKAFNVAAIPAALTEASGVIGGTNNLDIPALVTSANGTYSAAESTALNAAVREVADQLNNIRLALIA